MTSIYDITYNQIIQHPEVLPSLIGLSLREFNRLFDDFKAIHTRLELERRARLEEQKPRVRRVGAGRRHKYGLRDRLLITLFWMHVRPTHSVLSSMVGLNRCNIEKLLMDMQRTLKSPELGYCGSGQDRRLLRSVQAVIEAFPEIELLSKL